MPGPDYFDSCGATGVSTPVRLRRRPTPASASCQRVVDVDDVSAEPGSAPRPRPKLEGAREQLPAPRHCLHGGVGPLRRGGRRRPLRGDRGDPRASDPLQHAPARLRRRRLLPHEGPAVRPGGRARPLRSLARLPVLQGGRADQRPDAASSRSTASTTCSADWTAAGCSLLGASYRGGRGRHASFAVREPSPPQLSRAGPMWCATTRS